MQLCVYCAGLPGTNPVFMETAIALGREIAKRGHVLVYGGNKDGIMGAVANAAMGEGGKVVGIMPTILIEAERLHTGLTEIHQVADLHTRKALMIEMMDFAIVLPGAFGTMDELFEQVTLYRLKQTNKPCIVFNVDGFYDPLFALVKNMETAGYLHARDYECLLMARTMDEVFALVASSTKSKTPS